MAGSNILFENGTLLAMKTLCDISLQFCELNKKDGNYFLNRLGEM